jgi:hypothetical protein
MSFKRTSTSYYKEKSLSLLLIEQLAALLEKIFLKAMGCWYINNNISRKES